MKSLLVSSVYFPPQTGGISQLMAGLAAALGPSEVCCLTGAPTGLQPGPNAAAPGVYRRPRAFAGPRLLRSAALGGALCEVLLRERPRLVQIAHAFDGYVGLHLERWLHLPFIVYAHGNEILEARESPWEKPRQALRRAAHVLAVSRFTARLVENVGVAPERIEIVHPGCDAEFFRPLEPRADLRRKLLGPDPKQRVILSVGGLVARKGHDMVILALPRIVSRFPGVRYLIVGDGPHRGALESLALAVGVRDHVVFAGRMSGKVLPEIYALADVFAMPSRQRLTASDVEGFGLVFLEAASCGKPVVGGRSGGIEDAVVDGLTGLLADPESPEEIGDALVQILVDPALASRMGEQGRARVLKEFTWSRMARRVRDILGTISATPPNQAS